MKKALWAFAWVWLVAMFFAFEWQNYLTFAAIKGNLNFFWHYTEQHYAWMLLILFVAYVLLGALSLPGLIPLALLAGALFGLMTGVIVVTLAATLGAGLAFSWSRYALRDAAEQRFAHVLQPLNQRLEQAGIFYLFTLRLMPFIPNQLLNSAFGITQMPLPLFLGVSVISFLVMALVYVNAGTHLAQVVSVSSVLSWPLLGLLLLLGLFPWLIKWLVSQYEARQVYQGWTKPNPFQRQFIILGAGAAGLKAATIARQYQAKVTLIDTRQGTQRIDAALLRSILLKSAMVAEQMRHAKRYGLEQVEPKVPLNTVMQRLKQVLADLQAQQGAEYYAQLGIEYVRAAAQLIDPWTVEITHPDGQKQRLSSRSLLLAPSSKAQTPTLPLPANAYISSEQIWERLAAWQQLPQHIVILGGNAEGCELAQILVGLGAKVSLLETEEVLLAQEDGEVSRFVKRTLSEQGIQVLTQCRVLRAEQRVDDRYLIIAQQAAEYELAYDELIVVSELDADWTGYGLAALGLDDGQGLALNEYGQTIYPNIYAIGDYISTSRALAPALTQARQVVLNILFAPWYRAVLQAQLVPKVVVSTDPKVVRIGWNEREARERKVAYVATRYSMDGLARAMVESETSGWIKVLTMPDSDTILGVTLVGPQANALLVEYVIAMQRGWGLNKILRTPHSILSWSEANEQVALAWQGEHQAKGRGNWLADYHAGWRSAWQRWRGV